VVQQNAVGPVAIRIEICRFRVASLSVACRIHIRRASRQNEPVEPRRLFPEFSGVQIERHVHRLASCSPHGLEVVVQFFRRFAGVRSSRVRQGIPTRGFCSVSGDMGEGKS
jgi:hypothetical protein